MEKGTRTNPENGSAARKSTGSLAAPATVVLLSLIAAAASAQTSVTGHIMQNTTWTIGGSPYIIERSIVEVRGGSTLTVDPGVEVRFEQGTRLQTGAGSSIVAIGAPGDTIVFTSDSVSPAPGDWMYVGLFSSPASEFRRCRFEYAGEGLYLNASSPDIVLCIFENCGIALHILHASPRVEKCGFGPPESYSVLSHHSDSLPTFRNCNFDAGGAINIWLEDYSSPATVVATFNWWGTTDPDSIAGAIVDSTDNEPGNPQHGKGVVDYEPWLPEVSVEVSSWGRIKALFR